MASDTNRVYLIGRLTKDPEVKHTQSGTAVTSFSIANSRQWKDGDEKKEQTSFFNCVVWGKLGEEVVAKYAVKGQQIAIEGRLQQRSWEDKDGTKRSAVEIVVENVQLLAKPKADGNGQADDTNQPVPFNSATSIDDDIPF